VHGREHVLGEIGVDQLPALARDAELTPEQRLRGGRAEADDDGRLEDLGLCLRVCVPKQATPAMPLPT
jgi:hypothetical protein